MVSSVLRAWIVFAVLLLGLSTSLQAERRLLVKSKPEVQDIVAAEDGSFVCVGFFKDMLLWDGKEKGEPIATSAGEYDAFVARFAADGNLLWFVGIGSTQIDEAHSVAMAPDGAVVVTGFFQGKVDFDPGAGETVLETKPKEQEQFIAKFTSEGTLAWARSAGRRGGNPDEAIEVLGSSTPATRVRVDNDGNIHVLSVLNGRADVDPGEAEKVVDTQQSWKSVIAVYDSSGSYLEHAVLRLATTFLPVKGGWILGGEGSCGNGPRVAEMDGLVWRVGKDGQTVWSHRCSGRPTIRLNPLSDGTPHAFFDSRGSVEAVAAGPDGRIYATGYVQGIVDFNPDKRSKTDRLWSRLGNRLGFVAIFAQDGRFLEVTSIDTPTGRKSDEKYGVGILCTSIDVDRTGTVYVAGGCHSLTTHEKRKMGHSTAFVARLKGSRIAWLEEHRSDGAYAVAAIPGGAGVLFGGTGHWPPRPGKKKRTLISMGKGAFVAGYSRTGKPLKPVKD